MSTTETAVVLRVTTYPNRWVVLILVLICRISSFPYCCSLAFRHSVR